MTDPPEGERWAGHPSTEEIADYLNGKLRPADRESLEAHLAVCRECRQEVTSTRGLLATYRRPSRAMVWAVPAAAAAVLAWLVVAPPERRDGEAVRAGEEDTRPEAEIAVRVIAPADGDTLRASSSFVFLWHSHTGQPLFRLTLSDASGKQLWGAESRDTTLTLPPSITLDRGRTYYWHVDALGADGRSYTTRTQRFILAP